ncbi:MAG: hypothetical protein KIT10_12215 [Flavobacteriales bacterium]|nr:hypothetical protein [Flavobacteriales bacterium]
MRTILVSMAAILCLGSCTELLPTQTAKSLNIYGPGVIHHPVIVDLDVQGTKISASATGLASNIAGLRNDAISNAVKMAGADVLVEPVFETKPQGGRIVVTVTGFPATYKNFRPAQQADVPLLEAGVMRQAKVSEVAPQQVRKKGGGGAVVAIIVTFGLLIVVANRLL